MTCTPSDWIVRHYDEKLDMLALDIQRCAGSEIVGLMRIHVPSIDVWMRHSDNTHRVMIGGRWTGWFSATHDEVQTFLHVRADRLERKRQTFSP